MRSLFDQYEHEENRLTHALLSSLDKDGTLLRSFIRDFLGLRPGGRCFEIVEQGFPGITVDSPEEAERRGLPDGCISDETRWALLIESKITAGLNSDQLRRHISTARRYGLEECSLLVLCVRCDAARLPDEVLVRHWTEVYVWLQNQATVSPWARWCAEYFEIAETKFKLNEGTLTVFAGIPFDDDETPYSYAQAKRILGLLRAKVAEDPRLAKRLNADVGSAGRPAITGSRGTAVWDFISIRREGASQLFTQYPHLTLAIHADALLAYVTIPNGTKPAVRSAILTKSYKEFESVMARIAANLEKVLDAKAPAAQPSVIVVQRHYKSQRSEPVHDARLVFDMRTAVGRGSEVKRQPEWLQAAWEVLRGRRSKLQMQVGVSLPYATCDVVRSKEVATLVADTWLACAPLLDAAKKATAWDS
jgi:hypothetical protein